MHEIPDDLAELAERLLAGTPLTVDDALAVASGQRACDPTDPAHQALRAGWTSADQRPHQTQETTR